MNQPDLIALQNAEFHAFERLAKTYKSLIMTPVVDDDYPAVRFNYETELRGFLVAMANNNRFIRGNRYGLEEV